MRPWPVTLHLSQTASFPRKARLLGQSPTTLPPRISSAPLYASADQRTRRLITPPKPSSLLVTVDKTFTALPAFSFNVLGRLASSQARGLAPYTDTLAPSSSQLLPRAKASCIIVTPSALLGGRQSCNIFALVNKSLARTFLTSSLCIFMLQKWPFRFNANRPSTRQSTPLYAMTRMLFEKCRRQARQTAPPRSRINTALELLSPLPRLFFQQRMLTF